MQHAVAALALLLQVSGAKSPAATHPTGGPSVRLDRANKAFSMGKTKASTDRDAILDALDEGLEPVRGCWADALKSHPRMQGTIVVIFTVLPDGSISRPVLSQDGVNNRTVDDCVVRRLGEMRVPLEDRTIRVVAPLVFDNGRTGDGEAPAGGKPGTGKEELQGEAAIDDVLAQRKPWLYVCYTDALKKDPSLGGGELTVDFSIEENGRVRTATISHTTLFSRVLEDCFVQRVRLLKFAPPESGRVTLSRTFTFTPGEKIRAPSRSHPHHAH